MFNERPSQPLTVKCTLDRTSKRIVFASARNCTHELLRAKVDQGFSLSATSYAIQYTDDDGEVTEITTEDDLTEAIQYFQAGTDDPPMSSAASILSGRSFGSRKITLRVDIIVDYEGRLSDTGSMVSMEEYNNRPASELSFSFSAESSVVGDDDDDDDSMTVSSAQTGSGGRGPSFYGSSRSGSAGRQSWQPRQSSALARSVETAEDLGDIPEHHMEAYDNPSSSTLNEHHDPAAVFERLKLQESMQPASNASSSVAGHERGGEDRGAAWLRDQNARTIKSLLGQVPEPSVSDSSSQMALEVDERPQSVPGDLALQRDPQSGKYYYAYTGTSGSVSQNDGGDTQSFVERDNAPARVNSMQIRWITKHQVQTPEDYSETQERGGSSQTNPYYGHLDPDIPPEVLKFLPQGPLSAPPEDSLTDCSVCGIFLDSMRYVCNTCGEKAPVKSQETGSPYSVRDDNSPHAEMAYPPPGHRTAESSSPTLSSRTFTGSIGSGDSVTGFGPRRSKPLPSLPGSSASSVSPTLASPAGYFDGAASSHGGSSHGSHASSSSSGVTAPRPLTEHGYELCPTCLDSAGVLHAMEATLSTGPGSSPTSRTSSGEDARTLALWRRTAPKTKGSLRHGYLEKVWGYTGWEVVEHDEEVAWKCSTCNSAIMKNRYQCASCHKFDLCQACYSQVHEVHPNHAFLVVPDKRERSKLEHTFIPLMPDEHDEQSLTHPGVKCAHCMLDIVGARFHCAFCESIDICSNCESAGLPGNLDSSDGGHNSSHIMIKIPRPLESSEVDMASRQAMSLWTGRDAANVERASSKPGSVVSSSHTRTVIGKPYSSDSDPESHRMLCRGCTKPIVGVRYQCASCPSSPMSYSLCAICEEQSYSLHDPMHIFFKLPRPVRRPLESSFPMLPKLYKTPVGPTNGSQNTGDPTSYLRTLMHSSAVCDRCMTRIQGAWFRCAYCGKDLCDVCEELDTHDDTHVFMVFKGIIDMTIFRSFTDVENPTRSPPVIPYAIYR